MIDSEKFIMEKKMFEGWCGVCGTRTFEAVSVAFSNKPEHEKLDEGNGRYLRICASCINNLNTVINEQVAS